jgi:hypothetical protein
MKWRCTYKSKVARAEKDFDQNPAHLAERKCASGQKSESRVETFARSVFRSEQHRHPSTYQDKVQRPVRGT